MLCKAHLLILIMIMITTGCSSPAKTEQPATIEKSHAVSITGIVTSIDSINIDKSGKNPRFILHFMVKIESYDDGGWDTVLGPEIKCVISETDLLKKTGQKLMGGDRVLIITHIIEKSPTVIAVYTIEFL